MQTQVVQKPGEPSWRSRTGYASVSRAHNNIYIIFCHSLLDGGWGFITEEFKGRRELLVCHDILVDGIEDFLAWVF